MKKLLMLMLLSVATQMQAQFFIPIWFPAETRIGVDKKDIDDNYIPWSRDAIDFNNFKGVRKNYEKEDYYINVVTYLTLTKTKIGKTTYRYNENNAYIYTLKSWVNESADLESLKKYLQTQFDLWQLCSKQATIDYNTNGNITLEDMHASMDNEFTRQSNYIEKVTDEGRDSIRLAEIAGDIHSELDALSFNPEEAIKDKTEDWGLAFGFGLQSHTPVSKYVNSGYGCYVDWGFLSAKHIFGLGVNAEFFGKCQRDISTSKGNIYEGEGLVAGGMNLYYGYRTSYKRDVNLTPFVSIGARFYNGGTPVNPKYEDESCEKSGFSINAGMMFDIPIKRTVEIKLSSQKHSEYNTNSIQLRPYLSMTHFSGPMGWVPSINICVGYSLQSITLK